MARRYLWIASVNLFLLVLFAEIAGLFLYYIDTGALFYVHHKTYERITDTPESRLTGEALHPYFGPTHMPGLPLQIPAELRENQPPGVDPANPTGARTNNFGFLSAYDFPFARTRADQFLIGIFGGSVGNWFCHIGVPHLLRSLEANAYFKGRELVPLCFSHEGYKQPQQLLALTYFLSIGQEFDLVINIDGFNEVALASMNDQRGADISMPSPMHMQGLVNLIDRSTLTPERLRSMAAIQRDRDTLDALVTRLMRTRSAAVYVFLDRYYQQTRTHYYTELGRLSNLPDGAVETSMVRVTPKVATRDGAKLFADIASQWAQSSLMMQAMLRDRGVPYFHFLQPNQYFTTRRFGDAEARTALNPGSPFKSGAEQGYPALNAASRALVGKEPFFNGVGIFDEEPSPVYLDDCCHYTLRGNRLLADFVSASILGAEGPWRR
ncbi:MAG: hypothetical protein HOP16_05975 [Acidobacteria bacterium]|nr:hypothetical protein [Acidobacteriota bacterium]